MKGLSIEQFLALTKSDSSQCYLLFEELLGFCLAKDKEAIGLLHKLKDTCASLPDKNTHPFSFSRKDVRNFKDSMTTLWLLSFRSTYEPGEWSRTFYEGLSRYPTSDFYGRKVVELGCGNGWICLGLAIRNRPDKIFGVDINQRAILAAHLNAILNSFDSEGTPKTDEEGKTLMDRVHFEVSDLLEVFLRKKTVVDRIIGCIPQVLNPELAVLKDALASDEYLYSLSNYCARQGYVEDEFGLGLIAKAIEQAIALLRPTGKLIMNLGGRPGEQVLTKLMTRRGLSVKRIWQTITKQDSDTSIEGLVEIERETAHQFEFFMHPFSTVPICASTAQAFAEAGGTLYHAVTVYEATLRHPAHLKRLFQTISQPEYQDVRAALDLSQDDEAVAEERFSVSSSLAAFLHQQQGLPYGSISGLPHLLNHLSEFFGRYYYLPTQADNVMVSPSRTSLLANMLHLYRPNKLLIDSSLQSLLPWEWALRSKLGESVVHSPDDLALTYELIETLRPQMVFARLRERDAANSGPLDHLIRCCQEVQALLIIDISDIIELSSTPRFAGVFALLQEHGLPDNIFLLCGFIQNRVYDDLQLSVLLHGNRHNIGVLIDAAEVSYSRAPILTQRYYLQILEDLLNFHFDRNPSAPTPPPDLTTQTLCRTADVLEALRHPAIEGNKLPFTAESMRLDYGENELTMPRYLRQSLMASLLQAPVAAEELTVTDHIALHLEERFGIRTEYIPGICLGGGVADMFASIVRLAKSQGATMLFPIGAYGYFEAVLKYYQAPYKLIPTYATSSFKVSQVELEKILQEQKEPCWLYFNAPVTNPTGAIYSNLEIESILATCQEHKCSIAMDVIFSGIEYPGQQNSWSIGSSWSSVALQREGVDLLLLGGLSKEYAAAGLRFGYMASARTEIIAKISRISDLSPHRILLTAAQSLYAAMNRKESSLLEDLDKQRHILKERADRLSALLERTGWEVLAPQAGLFLVAKPNKILNRSVKDPRSGLPITLTSDSTADILFHTTGVAINGSSWTGIPDYCRFVLSTSESTFQRALQKIELFDSLLDYCD
jgi:methionine S-methyltransferase